MDAKGLQRGVLISGEIFAMRFGCSKLLYCINVQISIRSFLSLKGLSNKFGAGLNELTRRFCLCGYSFLVFEFLRVNNAHPY